MRWNERTRYKKQKGRERERKRERIHTNQLCTMRENEFDDLKTRNIRFPPLSLLSFTWNTWCQIRLRDNKKVCYLSSFLFFTSTRYSTGDRQIQSLNPLREREVRRDLFLYSVDNMSRGKRRNLLLMSHRKKRGLHQQKGTSFTRVKRMGV